jgi:hypothetical protein
MEVVSLDDATLSFNALSYVWGDPNATIPILVNQSVVIVPQSLAISLHSLRQISKSHTILGQGPLMIWADAVCLNQQDLQERSQQVQMMGEIYSKARKVLIWLGEGTEYTDYALDLMTSTAFWPTLERLRISDISPSDEEIIVDVVLKQVLCK